LSFITAKLVVMLNILACGNFFRESSKIFFLICRASPLLRYFGLTIHPEFATKPSWLHDKKNKKPAK
jgi:hypothetical protein